MKGPACRHRFNWESGSERPGSELVSAWRWSGRWRWIEAVELSPAPVPWGASEKPVDPQFEESRHCIQNQNFPAPPVDSRRKVLDRARNPDRRSFEGYVCSRRRIESAFDENRVRSRDRYVADRGHHGAGGNYEISGLDSPSDLGWTAGSKQHRDHGERRCHQQ